MNKEFNKEEYNGMCAEFLGWKFENGYYNNDMLHPYSFISKDNLQFHDDWNWIMILIDKIEEKLTPALEWMASVGLKAINKLQELWTTLSENIDFEGILTLVLSSIIINSLFQRNTSFILIFQKINIYKI